MKKKYSVEIYSYGHYENWDKNSKKLPDLVEITDTIKAEVGIEFGYVLYIKKAKGMKLSFVINHPSIMDKEGKKMSPFTGESYINSNDYQFFLGDTIWEPVDDKKGHWTLITKINDEVVAKKTLKLI